MSVSKTIGLPEEGGYVTWEVSAPHYVSQRAIGVEVHSSSVEYVNLGQETYSIVFYINPTDSTLTVNGSVRPETGFRRVISGFHYGDSVTFMVSKENYLPIGDTIVINGDMEVIVNIDESALNKHTITINPLPLNATVLINGVQRTTAELIEGTTVSWSVSAENYIPQSGSLILMNDVSMNVHLVWNGRYTFTINPDPSNATVIMNGVQQQSISVYDGDVVEWSVSAPGYETLSGIYSVTCNYTLNVHLVSSTSEMLTFKVTDPGNLYWVSTGGSHDIRRELQYSLNGGAWTETTADPIYLDVNDEIVFKGTHHYYGNTYYGHTYDGHMYFSNMENGDDDGLRFEVRGDIRSLFSGDNYQHQTSYDHSGYSLPSLFEGCGAVTDASRLVIKIVPFGACMNMFKNCVNLVNPSMDPCARGGSMYEGCARLVSTPPVLAGNMGSYDVSAMFKNCVSLKLASYILLINGYSGIESIFEGCTRLTSSPVIGGLPSSWSSNYIRYAFKGCRSLQRITSTIVATTGMPEPITITDWVDGVNESGMFIKDANTTWSVGNSGIPTDWVTSTSFPTFTFSINATPSNSIIMINSEVRSSYAATPGETITWSVSKSGYVTQTGSYTMGYGSYTENVSLSPNNLKFVPDSTGHILWQGDATIEYSTDGTNWTSVTGTSVGAYIPVTQNVPIMFRGSLTRVFPSKFIIDTAQGTVAGTISGDVDSLIDEELIESDCFRSLFSGCKSIRNHATEEILLPLTTLASNCYNNMFTNCIGLTRTPVMSATTGASYCCSSMFYGCTSLTTAYPINIQVPQQESLAYMFYGCTSLVNAPELNIVANMGSTPNYIAYGMFEGCTSLTSVYIGDWANYGRASFDRMFYGCSSLNDITCLVHPSNYSFADWVSGVASDGVFKYYYMYGRYWSSGVSGIPTDWAREAIS